VDDAIHVVTLLDASLDLLSKGYYFAEKVRKALLKRRKAN
jgi:hypothetical protein